MLCLYKSVIFILLISYGASYGSQDNTYNDEHVNSNQTISYKDYEGSFSSNLLNLLSTLSLYYDGFRLPLRATEIAAVVFFDLYIFKMRRATTETCRMIFSYSLASSHLANGIYDTRMNVKNHGISLLSLAKFIAQRIEHIMSLAIAEHLLVILFTEPCPICLESLRFPVQFATCARHLFCAACIGQWRAHSPFCPVCRQ